MANDMTPEAKIAYYDMAINHITREYDKSRNEYGAPLSTEAVTLKHDDYMSKRNELERLRSIAQQEAAQKQFDIQQGLIQGQRDKEEQMAQRAAEREKMMQEAEAAREKTRQEKIKATAAAQKRYKE
jgi:hypothetical protein